MTSNAVMIVTRLLSSMLFLPPPPPLPQIRTPCLRGSSEMLVPCLLFQKVRSGGIPCIALPWYRQELKPFSEVLDPSFVPPQHDEELLFEAKHKTFMLFLRGFSRLIRARLWCWLHQSGQLCGENYFFM